MSRPEFSVIVPTYNRAPLLPRCIDSLRRQEFADFEIVVADDGSTDETAAVVHRLSQQDPRIRYARQENQGGGAARNLGASLTTAEYLAFLDSDDEVDIGWLNSLWRQIRQHQADIVCCGIRYVSGAGEFLRERLPGEIGGGTSVSSGLYRSGTFAIRREVFDSVGGYAAHLQANQHSELRCRLELQSRRLGWKTACLPNVLVTAHEHDGAKIRKNDAVLFESARFILGRHGSLLRENPETFASWASACAGAAARLGLYQDARHWFWQALLTHPWKMKHLARLTIACSPGVRRWCWGRRRSTE